jgi:catechol 2,3-dioxygenase-like lactoylglutathione lyase family enzyme
VSIESINAITLATQDMRRAVAFYQALQFELIYGGAESSFSSLRAGIGFVNLTRERPEGRWSRWGRVIFHVTDVVETYAKARAAGFETDTQPRDAQWGERYFHITDPDGHELSFAKLLGVILKSAHSDGVASETPSLVTRFSLRD